MKSANRTSSYGRDSRSANAFMSERDFSMKISRRSRNNPSALSEPWYSNNVGKLWLIIKGS